MSIYPFITWQVPISNYDFVVSIYGNPGNSTLVSVSLGSADSVWGLTTDTNGDLTNDCLWGLIMDKIITAFPGSGSAVGLSTASKVTPKIYGGNLGADWNFIALASNSTEFTNTGPSGSCLVLNWTSGTLDLPTDQLTSLVPPSPSGWEYYRPFASSSQNVGRASGTLIDMSNTTINPPGVWCPFNCTYLDTRNTQSTIGTSESMNGTYASVYNWGSKTTRALAFGEVPATYTYRFRRADPLFSDPYGVNQNNPNNLFESLHEAARNGALFRVYVAPGKFREGFVIDTGWLSDTGEAIADGEVEGRLFDITLVMRDVVDQSNSWR